MRRPLIILASFFLPMGVCVGQLQGQAGLVQESLPDPKWTAIYPDAPDVMTLWRDYDNEPMVCGKAQLRADGTKGRATLKSTTEGVVLKGGKFNIRLRASRETPYSFMYMYGLPPEKNTESFTTYTTNDVEMSTQDKKRSQVLFPCTFYVRALQAGEPERYAFVQLVNSSVEERLTIGGDEGQWHPIAPSCFEEYRIDVAGAQDVG